MRSRAIRVGAKSFALALLAGVGTSHADERPTTAAGRFALEVSGTRCGLVRALENERGQGQRHLSLTAQELTPAFASLIDTYAQGKPVKRDLRLTSGAVVRKANDARLVSVKLPAIGAGGPTDVDLDFLAPSITTQPLLSAKEAPALPPSARITTFRVDIAGMQAIEAAKLDAITLSQRSDGSTTTGDIAIEVAAGGGPPFVAWHKASVAKSSPRALHLEYVGADGNAILKLHLGRCTPTEVKPLGASGTTRISLSCTATQ